MVNVLPKIYKLRRDIYGLNVFTIKATKGCIVFFLANKINLSFKEKKSYCDLNRKKWDPKTQKLYIDFTVTYYLQSLERS